MPEDEGLAGSLGYYDCFGEGYVLVEGVTVEGDVFHKSLTIEQGAFFEGKSRRADDPLSVQRTANGLPPPG